MITISPARTTGEVSGAPRLCAYSFGGLKVLYMSQKQAEEVEREFFEALLAHGISPGNADRCLSDGGREPTRR